MYLRTLQIQFSIKPKKFRGKYMNNFSVFYGNFQGIQTFLLFYTDFTDIVQLSFIMLSFLLYLNIQFHKIFEPIVFYINISSVVEFQIWWVLKSKLFGQESTCSKEILIPTALNHLWFSVVGVLKVEYLDFPCEIFEILCELDVGVIACIF